jgi:hypothetical protein
MATIVRTDGESIADARPPRLKSFRATTLFVPATTFDGPRFFPDQVFVKGWEVRGRLDSCFMISARTLVNYEPD